MKQNRKSKDEKQPLLGLRVKTTIKAGGLEYDFSTGDNDGGTCQPPSVS